jgi:hypothetical protein
MGIAAAPSVAEPFVALLDRLHGGGSGLALDR